MPHLIWNAALFISQAIGVKNRVPETCFCVLQKAPVLLSSSFFFFSFPLFLFVYLGARIEERTRDLRRTYLMHNEPASIYLFNTVDDWGSSDEIEPWEE